MMKSSTQLIVMMIGWTIPAIINIWSSGITKTQYYLMWFCFMLFMLNALLDSLY